MALNDDASVVAATELSPTIHAQEESPLGPENETGTCYAFATATAVRSAQMRIFARAVERHDKLVKEITDEFGCDGADVGSFSGEREGHAIVITGQSDEAWFIKSSWGEDFADDGYFRVAKNAIRFRYYDVCFRTCDLRTSEKNAYRLAPAVLEVTLVYPDRSERNPISPLGWEIDFETMRIERVRKRNCSIARWNRENPFKKSPPGYQIVSVNGCEDRNDIISHLHHAHVELQLSLVIMNGFARLDDVLHDRALQFSYAHRIATAIRNTQARIFSRTVELHDDIFDEIVTRWGTADVKMDAVVQDACSRRGLHYSCLTTEEAVHDVLRRGGREILATFSLDASAWNRFSQFFTDHPGSVLGREHLQHDASLPQQAATALICALRNLSGQLCWGVRDPWAWSETSRIIWQPMK
eukprot:Skav216658  [mRNA]  locus=scaffold1255:658553:660021:- [translate_table: standard]